MVSASFRKKNCLKSKRVSYKIQIILIILQIFLAQSIGYLKTKTELKKWDMDQTISYIFHKGASGRL